MQARYCSQSLTAMPSCCSTWQQTMRRSRSLAIYRRTDSPRCRAMLLLLYYNDSIIIMIQLYTLYYDSTIMTASLSWYSFDKSTSQCLFQSPGMFAQHPSYHGDSSSTRGLQCMFAQHQSYESYVCVYCAETHTFQCSQPSAMPAMHTQIHQLSWWHIMRLSWSFCDHVRRHWAEAALKQFEASVDVDSDVAKKYMRRPSF